jgi:dTDP-4-dehydrorhamnose reductase
MATHLVGATGNIGKRVVEKGGDKINALSRFELKLDQRPLYYNFDAKTIGGTAIKEGDVIIFAAAISEPSVVSAQFDKALAVNVESTGEFIETALGKGCKVLFLSSDAVYGNVETGFDESHPTNPKGAYAEMKAIVEKRFEGNPNFKVLRLSYNFYKDDRFTKYLRQCAESGVEAEVFDPLTRAVVHRDDTVDAILNIAADWDNADGQYINCGGPEVLSRQQFTEIVRDTALPSLKFKVTAPPAKFYTDRAAFSEMHSPNLEKILGRKRHTVKEAVELEFGVGNMG